MKINLSIALLLLISVLIGCNKRVEKAKETAVVKEEPMIVAPEITELEKNLISQGLTNIQELDSTIMVELKYSTTDNFFGEDVYGDLTRAYLQPDVAAKLQNAQRSLATSHPNLQLLVYDGVRPHSVQKILWDKLDSLPTRSREAFVANPKKGSIHNYGCAVDLTIFDAERDSVLDMGTKYDYFGYLAYPRKESENLQRGLLNREQIKNRSLLRSVMIGAGFMPITSEWWHFNAVSLRNAEATYRIVQ